MPNQDNFIFTTKEFITPYKEGQVMSNDYKKIKMSTMERVKDVRFILLVIKILYRTYVTPYIILYCDLFMILKSIDKGVSYYNMYCF